MTIAVCYLTPEGIVLGADSTSSMATPGGMHYFNHAQKLFEIGEGTTMGVVTWGIAGVSTRSYRTLFALLADGLAAKPAKSMKEVADRWVELFWPEYSGSPLIGPLIKQCQELHKKKAFEVIAAQPDPEARTEPEEKAYKNYRFGLVVGFCIAGYMTSNRVPEAYSIVFDPLADKPTPVGVQRHGFWGAPNMIERLIVGRDGGLKDKILSSGKWTGTDAELQKTLNQFRLAHPILPMREAIDFVFTCIYSTIKALKFSNFSQICGGPIEIATITTDRRFRWVRHKSWDIAITEGDPS